jgi:secernin
VCVGLLEAHGQGGACACTGDVWTYENGFLFADATEAFVIETAGVRHWAVERVPPGGYRNISNGLSIREPTSLSAGVTELCTSKGWWDGQGQFDWKASVGEGGRAHAMLEVSERETAGAAHLREAAAQAASGSLRADDIPGWIGMMMNILRDEASGICFRDTDGFCTTGSQISWLPPREGARGVMPVVTHLFTAASDPLVACYKRVAFSEDAAAAVSDYGSLALWNKWRALALRGGLEKCGLTEEAQERVTTALHAIEARAVTDAANAHTGVPERFAEAIAQELAVLDSEGL